MGCDDPTHLSLCTWPLAITYNLGKSWEEMHRGDPVQETEKSSRWILQLGGMKKQHPKVGFFNLEAWKNNIQNVYSHWQKTWELKNRKIKLNSFQRSILLHNTVMRFLLEQKEGKVHIPCSILQTTWRTETQLSSKYIQQWQGKQKLQNWQTSKTTPQKKKSTRIATTNPSTLSQGLSTITTTETTIGK